MLQSDIMEALCLVITVDFLQLFIQQIGKMFEGIRGFCKLNEPLMTAFRLAVHVDRSGSIFADFSPCFLAGIGQSLLCIVHNQLFSKGIDEVFGATCDDKLIGIRARETHGVANDIAPQPATRCNHHGIVNALLHTLKWNDCRIIRAILVHGNEFIEYIIVGHQQKTLVLRVTLNAEEAFTGVVSLHILHLPARDKLFILRAIRRESNATMKENFKVGPYFFKVFLAGKLHDTHQNTQHPTGNTRDIRHVLMEAFACDAVAFHLEITQQSRLLLRHTHEICQRIYILYEDCTEVSDKRTCHIIIRRMTATED